MKHTAVPDVGDELVTATEPSPMGGTAGLIVAVSILNVLISSGLFRRRPIRTVRR